MKKKHNQLQHFFIAVVQCEMEDGAETRGGRGEMSNFFMVILTGRNNHARDMSYFLPHKHNLLLVISFNFILWPGDCADVESIEKRRWRMAKKVWTLQITTDEKWDIF
jgi:hypothetical protein